MTNHITQTTKTLKIFVQIRENLWNPW